MYNTSDNYKSKIYLPSTKHLLRVFINGEEIPSKSILGFDSSYLILPEKNFTFGSVTSQNATLKLENSALPNDIDNIYIVSGIKEEEVPIGYFKVKDVGEQNSATITLKLEDYMTEFEANYNGKELIEEKVEPTLLEVLQDICKQVGVELGSTSFLNADSKTAQYDNTISARSYLSYIAEQAGGFAVIGRDGKLYIKQFKELEGYELDINLFGEYKWGEEFKVTRVRYEDGVRLFEKGDETGNTVYISQENMYINNQKQIDNIYEKINGLDVFSFSGKTIIDPALDVGDIVPIDGKKVIYQGSMTYGGRFQANISSEIQSKQQEETTSRVASEKVLRRRIQSQINEVEGKIKFAVEEVGEQNEKIGNLSLRVDELDSKIGEVADITVTKQGFGQLEFEGINESEPIYLRIYPRFDDISHLYPRPDLYPSPTLYPHGRTLRFINTKTNKIFDYELPDDLLYYNDEIYDEFILNYEDLTCTVYKRVGINLSNGEKYPLENTQMKVYDYPVIPLEEGDYTIKVMNSTNAFINARLMAVNIYTSQFATKVEMKSEIKQTAGQFELELRKKVGTDEVATIISATADRIFMSSNNFGWQSDNSSMTTDGKISTKAGDISGFIIENDKLKKSFNALYNYSNFDIIIAAAAVMNWVNIPYSQRNIWDVDNSGNINSADFLAIRQIINRTRENTKNVSGNIMINSNDPKNCLVVEKDGSPIVSLGVGGINSTNIITNQFICGNFPNNVSDFRGAIIDDSGKISIVSNGATNTEISQEGIITPVVTQTSLESIKKNFKKCDSVLDIIKNSEIYEYNLKSEQDTDKKHYGFVIPDEGGDFKTPDEVISSNGKGIETYSMESILWKAVQEQQKQIEELQNKIKELEDK